MHGNFTSGIVTAFAVKKIMRLFLGSVNLNLRSANGVVTPTAGETVTLAPNPGKLNSGNLMSGKLISGSLISGSLISGNLNPPKNGKKAFTAKQINGC
jgi:hypothetical protein